LRRESRWSALWGTGSKGGKEILTGALTLVALALPLAAGAEPGKGKGKAGGAFVPAGLLKKAERDEDATFRVIVQGEGKGRGAVAAEGGRVKREFETVEGVAAELTGKQLAKLVRRGDVVAVTEDGIVGADYWNEQEWAYVADVDGVWPSRKNNIQAATIAVVDSGVDASRPDLAGRVVEQVVLASLAPNSPGDGRGHGTFVASIAAGGVNGHTGAAPNAKIVSLDVLNDAGQGLVSDVIAAADWIHANKDRLGIRVANFSLHAATAASFHNHPLNKAVEKLWLGGVVVVASVGNYGTGSEVRVGYAPGNDPFVITVGAVGGGNASTGDLQPAPWSAYGYTYDGFRKPEIAAPGRYMVGAVPPGATMALERPDRVVAPGYMRMSGTSFAAPVIAGTAAAMLGLHPAWTPDQVKGVLMLKARAVYGSVSVSSAATGVGLVAATDAGWYVGALPNPNAGLNRFVVPDPNGGLMFDAAAWYDAAWSDKTWDAAAWSDAAWNSAAWNSAAWSDAAWSDAAWYDAAWSDAAWSDAAWFDAAWADLFWLD
jgi:serine protease AprX